MNYTQKHQQHWNSPETFYVFVKCYLWIHSFKKRKLIVGHRLSLLQADIMGVYSSDLYPPKWEIASNWVGKMLMLVRSPELISVFVLFFFMLSYPTFLHSCWIIVLILIQVTIKVKVMWRLCLKNLMWGKLLFNVIFTAYGTCWGWGLISQTLQYEFDPLSVDTAHYLLGVRAVSKSEQVPVVLMRIFRDDQRAFLYVTALPTECKFHSFLCMFSWTMKCEYSERLCSVGLKHI